MIKDVTIEARAIFGEDIVKEAYQDTSYCYKGGGSISYTAIEPQDGCPVYVVFSNGKRFKIWASEWGGVTTVI